MRTVLAFILIILSFQNPVEPTNYDVIVYGGTPEGVVAAVAASLALKEENNVHQISVQELQTKLAQEGMIRKIEDLGSYSDYAVNQQ